MKNDSLSKAIAYLGAVEVIPPGCVHSSKWPARYAVKCSDCWCIAPGSDLEEYADADHRARQFIAATWVAMPPWWTPDSRFAWRYAAKRAASEHDNAMHAAASPRFICSAHWFTADLETGAEVPA